MKQVNFVKFPRIGARNLYEQIADAAMGRSLIVQCTAAKKTPRPTLIRQIASVSVKGVIHRPAEPCLQKSTNLAPKKNNAEQH